MRRPTGTGSPAFSRLLGPPVDAIVDEVVNVLPPLPVTVTKDCADCSAWLAMVWAEVSSDWIAVMPLFAAVTALCALVIPLIRPLSALARLDSPAARKYDVGSSVGALTRLPVASRPSRLLIWSRTDDIANSADRVEGETEKSI